MTASTHGSHEYFDHPGALLCAGAVGFALGMGANLGRKAVIQGLTAVQGAWDEGLKAEHQATLKIFDAIEASDTQNVKQRGVLLMQLTHSLSKHAFQEEYVIYPAMREHGQVKEADQLVHDHGYVKQYLYELTEMPASDPAWIGKVRKFREDIEKHIRMEENQLFPRLRDQLGRDGNAHVTRMMNKAGLAAA